MTERKPPSVSFESWVDRQIRQADERGELDDLPGAGKPLRGLDKPYDELWWIREKMAREGISLLPPTLALRKDAEEALAAALRAGSERQVRRILDDVNDRIRRALGEPSDGPPLNLVPFDVEQVVQEWRDRSRGR